MDESKEEFKHLIESLGWSQTEAAQQLCKTPSAINHLLNPNHPNKPTRSTLQMLRLIAHDAARNVDPLSESEHGKLMGEREGELIQRLVLLPSKNRNRAYALIKEVVRLAEKGKV